MVAMPLAPNLIIGHLWFDHLTSTIVLIYRWPGLTHAPLCLCNSSTTKSLVFFYFFKENREAEEVASFQKFRRATRDCFSLLFVLDLHFFYCVPLWSLLPNLNSYHRPMLSSNLAAWRWNLLWYGCLIFKSTDLASSPGILLDVAALDWIFLDHATPNPPTTTFLPLSSMKGGEP